MFLWQALKPAAVLAVLRALSSKNEQASTTPGKADDVSATGASGFRLANPCDPNSLT
jgi:hypothetical protein